MVLKACSIYLIDEEGKILLQHRDDKPNIWNPGAWGLFGGSVEGTETFEEAIIRETKEELNYNLINPGLFQKFSGNDGDDYGDYEIHSFFKKIKNSEKEFLKLLEGQGWGWFTLDEANELDWKEGWSEWKRNLIELRKIVRND